MDLTVGIIGGGRVGQTLSFACAKKGYTVLLGSENISTAWQKLNPKVKVDSYEAAASESDFVILAIPGKIAEEVVKSLAESLEDKVVLDVTNPIEQPRGQDTTLFALPGGVSLMEHLQALAPKASVMEDPKLEIMLNEETSTGPTMFFCGDDKDSKDSTRYLLADLGWDPVDVGPATSARMMEHLSLMLHIRQHISGSDRYALQLLPIE